jgi:hypothetical protein
VAWLIQPVGEITYRLDRHAARARVQLTLAEHGLATELHQTAPELTARCVSLCLNLGLWRCWSERLEVTFRDVGPAETRVTINAVPSWSRTGARAGEQVTDLGKLLSALK